MSVYDRWHKTRPGPGEEPCREHSRGRTKLYPTADHGKGDRWQVRWRDETGQQRKRNFAKRDGTDPERHAAPSMPRLRRHWMTAPTSIPRTPTRPSGSSPRTGGRPGRTT